jgi:DNA transformation protein
MLTEWEEQENADEQESLAVVGDPFEPQPTPEETLRDCLMATLENLEPLTWKPMFEGFGIFSGKGMFCLIDQYGRPAFRVSELSEVKYRSAGSERIGRLTFWTIPEDVMQDPEALTEWATEALGIAFDVQKSAFKY